MLYPRVACIALLLGSLGTIYVAYGVLQMLQPDGSLANITIASALIALGLCGLIGIYVGVSGLVVSFGLVCTSTGRFRPGERLFGRLVGLFVPEGDSGTFCLTTLSFAGASFAACLLIVALALFTARHFGLLLPAPQHEMPASEVLLAVSWLVGVCMAAVLITAAVAHAIKHLPFYTRICPVRGG